MHEFSIVDGFMDVNDCLAEMIKYVANEPSVGLFFVQQHTQNAVPNLIKNKDQVVAKSHETALHTEDLEDSINVVRSMKECGMPIVDEMIKDIKKSLSILSTTQPRRGVIRHPSSGRRSESWDPAAFSSSAAPTHQNRGSSSSSSSSSGYLSTMLNSAKQRAAGLGWPQLDPTHLRNLSAEKLLFSPAQPLSETVGSSGLTVLETENDEQLPLSCQMGEELFDQQPSVGRSSSFHDQALMSENYEKFRSDREAKLKEWLGELEIRDATVEASDSKRV